MYFASFCINYLFDSYFCCDIKANVLLLHQEINLFSDPFQPSSNLKKKSHLLILTVHNFQYTGQLNQLIGKGNKYILDISPDLVVVRAPASINMVYSCWSATRSVRWQRRPGKRTVMILQCQKVDKNSIFRRYVNCIQIALRILF